MKKLLLFATLICFSITSCDTTHKVIPTEPKLPTATPKTINGEYTLVVEGYDWGAAASKVILSNSDSLSDINANNYEVYVQRSTSCIDLKPEEANGNLKVLYAYLSNAKGKKCSTATHITLALYAAPFETINSPIKYFFGNPNCKGNQWIDFDLTITNAKTKKVWDKEKNRIIPLMNKFDLTQRFTHEDVTLRYAHYKPIQNTAKRPLIIWLHGGGEGGTDTTIPLLANRAANYASSEIQTYFDGAHVLVPQSPTFWMDNGTGQYTRGEVNDMYNESLMALIKDYVAQNQDIDEDRIYLGGCSNGGYMTLKLLMLHPDYFAAAFPSALAYHAKNLTDNDVERIKDIPIWFIHSKDDNTTVASETVIPVYEKLIAAGAKNVHLSLFDHVIDITNQFGGENFHYMGHFSWIYSHANKCQLDYDGEPVMADGQPVTLMGWLARQHRTSN